MSYSCSEPRLPEEVLKNLSEEVNDKAIAEAFNAFRAAWRFANINGCDISIQPLQNPNLQFSTTLAENYNTLVAFFEADTRFAPVLTSIRIATRVIVRNFLLRTLRKAKIEGIELATNEQLQKLNAGGLDDGSELSNEVKFVCQQAIVHFQEQNEVTTADAITAAFTIIWPPS